MTQSMPSDEARIRRRAELHADDCGETVVFLLRLLDEARSERDAFARCAVERERERIYRAAETWWRERFREEVRAILMSGDEE